MGEIRFVGTGETRGYPYLVCKKGEELTEDETLSGPEFFSISPENKINKCTQMTRDRSSMNNNTMSDWLLSYEELCT